MSIEITPKKCIGCGKCAEICPGALIILTNGESFVPRPERCWGCASCVKECPKEAIALYLGGDIGGLGGRMTARREGALLHWRVTMPDLSVRGVTVDSGDSNRY